MILLTQIVLTLILLSASLYSIAKLFVEEMPNGYAWCLGFLVLSTIVLSTITGILWVWY
jgi:hypothetical protein